MPLWHCPHCGTPQPEAARCWVCRKSSTSCATCRHFRRGVAASLGYCGLDRRHGALHGDELRACWDGVADPAFRALGIGASSSGATPAAAVGAGNASLEPSPETSRRRPIEWHEVADHRPEDQCLQEVDARAAAAPAHPRAQAAAERGEIPARPWIQGFWADADV